MLLFKINSHKKKYFDDFLNGYSLAVTFADWLTGLVFHTVTLTFIALVSPSVHRNKVCIRDYTSTAFSTTIISRNFSARFLWFKQLLWTSNDFYIEFGEIITYHSIGMYSDLWSLLHVSKQKKWILRVHIRFCVDPHYTDTQKLRRIGGEIAGPIVVEIPWATSG